MLAAAWYAFFEGRERPTDREAFDERLASAGASLVPTFQAVLDRVRCGRRQALRTRESPGGACPRQRWTQPAPTSAANSIRWWAPGSCRPCRSERLADVPRYLDGMAVRLDGLQGRVGRDREGMAAVAVWEGTASTPRRDGWGRDRVALPSAGIPHRHLQSAHRHQGQGLRQAARGAVCRCGGQRAPIWAPGESLSGFVNKR